MQRRELLSATLVLPAATLLLSGGRAMAQSTELEAIKTANQAFYDALTARDIKAMEAIWANKPYVVNIGPRSKTAAVGYEEAVKKYWSGAFDFFSAINAASISIASIQSDGRFAWVVGTESANLQPKSGGEPLKFNLFSTNIFEKESARWLMITHHAQMIPT